MDIVNFSSKLYCPLKYHGFFFVNRYNVIDHLAKIVKQLRALKSKSFNSIGCIEFIWSWRRHSLCT